MKKFLTMLLALSVVFTYTFGAVGSVYATATTTVTLNSIVDDDDYNYSQIVALINAQADNLKGMTDTAKSTALTTALSSNYKVTVNATDYAISYKAIESVFTDLADEEKDEAIPAQVTAAMVLLNTAFAGQPQDYTVKGTAVKGYMDGMTANYPNADAFLKYITTDDGCDVDFMIAQLGEEAATVTKALDKVKLEDYSTEKPNTAPFKSNATLVEDAKKAANNTIEANAFDKTTDTTTASLAAKITAVKGALTTFNAAIATIPTLKADAVTKVDLDAIKADAKATYAAAVNTALAAAVSTQNTIILTNKRVDPQTSTTKQNIANAEAAIAEANKAYPALITIMNMNIDAATQISDLTTDYTAATGAYTLKSDYTTLPTGANLALALEVAAAKIDYAKVLEKQAADLKAAISISGSASVDANSVDEDLADELEAMYAAVVAKPAATYTINGAGSYTSVLDGFATVFNVSGKTEAQILNSFITEAIGTLDDSEKIAIDKVEYSTLNAWKDMVDDGDYNYDTDQADLVDEIADDAIVAITEAKTIAEAKEIFLTAYAKLDAVVTTAEHNKLVAKGGVLYEDYTGYVAQLNAAVAAKRAITNNFDGYNVNKSGNLATNLIATFAKANTAADMKAAFEKAKNTVESLKTNKEIKAEFAALDERVMKVATPVTLTAKDEVLAIDAAYDELADYVALVDGTPYSTQKVLNDAYVAAVEKLAIKALEDAYTAIGTVELSDADAVKALRDAYEAHVETFGLCSSLKVTNVTIGTLEAKVSQAKVDDVTTKMAALAVDGKNEDAVKAVRDAYNALTAAEKATIDSIAKLEAAEAAVEAAKKEAEEAAKWTDKDVKAAMYDAAKTTSYTKPSKTSVKLTAKANVAEIKENGYTVKYRFYQKGPKKTSYKLWKTTTSNNYTFKSLKKGTHYFKVKISVYNAEGKLVAYKYTNVRTLKIK